MPVNDLGLDYGPQPEHLTRREQFAMAAMQGLLANPLTLTADGISAPLLPFIAVTHADALIAELDKKQSK